MSKGIHPAVESGNPVGDFVQSYKTLHSYLEQRKVFLRCSGFQTLLAAADLLKKGEKIDEIVLLGLLEVTTSLFHHLRFSINFILHSAMYSRVLNVY